MRQSSSITSTRASCEGPCPIFHLAPSPSLLWTSREAPSVRSGAGAWPDWSGQSDLLHQAAIRKKRAPGDVACLVGGEEGDEVRNLLHLARSPHRYFCQRLVGLLRIINRRRRHRRRDHAGCDVVDPHALPG